MIAKSGHNAGDEVLLDYGDHSLQHWLCQYGFVPPYIAGAQCSEVFEDFGNRWELLVVQGSPQVLPCLAHAM